MMKRGNKTIVSLMIFLILILIGMSGSLFYVLLKMNSNIESLTFWCRENAKDTGSLDRTMSNLVESVQDIKVYTIGKSVKNNGKYYLRGGIYGQIRVLNLELTDIHKELSDIKTELDEIKKDMNEVNEKIGSKYSPEGIIRTLDKIKSDIDTINTRILIMGR